MPHGGPVSESVVRSRQLYIESSQPISLRQLAKRFKGHEGGTFANLQVWSRREEWTRQRAEHWQDIDELSRRRSKQEAAKQLARGLKGHELIRDHAIRSVVKRAANGELMQLGAASTAMLAHQQAIEEKLGIGVPENIGDVPTQSSLTDVELADIMAIPNPLSSDNGTRAISEGTEGGGSDEAPPASGEEEEG